MIQDMDQWGGVGGSSEVGNEPSGCIKFELRLLDKLLASQGPCFKNVPAFVGNLVRNVRI